MTYNLTGLFVSITTIGNHWFLMAAIGCRFEPCRAHLSMTYYLTGLFVSIRTNLSLFKPGTAGLDSFILEKDIVYVGVAISTAIRAYVP